MDTVNTQRADLETFAKQVVSLVHIYYTADLTGVNGS